MTTPAWRVTDALSDARALGIERLDAQWLIASALQCSRAWLLAHDDAVLNEPQAQALRAAFAQRAAGVPLAYLLGEQEFHGLTLQVNAAVLVPRPDTELLVDWALELLAHNDRGAGRRPRVVDLGTGSGAIALAVKHGHPRAEVLATDVSAAALAVARANAARLGLELSLRQSSWWSALAGRRFDLVLANPPYIAAGDPHLAALHHEPALALTPGGDGLDALRRISAGAVEHLEPAGWLLLEHGYDQAEAVRALLRGHGLARIETRHDLGGRPRCTGACR